MRWTFAQVLPLVLELGQDIIWRVRRAVMVSVPLLTERMGVSYFEENLLELYLQVRAKIPPDNLIPGTSKNMCVQECGLWMYVYLVYNRPT